jgi:hypothetical protein
MRWQRSSAWSWIAGVHSRSRNATLEARGQRDPLRAHARGADDQLRAAVVLERADRVLARLGGVAAEQVRGVREALEHEVLDLAVAAEHDERLVGGQEVVDPRQRRAELAARREPLAAR